MLSYEKSKSTDMMDCIHGIRVISTQWVVLGHTFLMYVMFPIRNKTVIPEVVKIYFILENQLYKSKNSQRNNFNVLVHEKIPQYGADVSFYLS